MEIVADSFIGIHDTVFGHDMTSVISEMASLTQIILCGDTYV